MLLQVIIYIGEIFIYLYLNIDNVIDSTNFINIVLILKFLIISIIIEKLKLIIFYINLC